MWIFDHIPKTGGTSLMGSWAPAALLADEYATLTAPDLVEGRDEVLQRLPQLSPRTKLIGGHYASWIKPLFPDWNLITIVRDPVDRAISSYLHVRHHPDGNSPPGTSDRTNVAFSFEEFVTMDTNNYQVRLMLGLNPLTFAQMADDEILDLLESRFTLVGDTDQLDTFVFFLHAFLGFPLALFANKLVRPEKENFRLSKSELALVRRFNQHDIRLHDLVTGNNEHLSALARAKGYGGHLRSYLSALATFRRNAGENTPGRIIAPPKTAVLLRSAPLERFQSNGGVGQISSANPGIEVRIEGQPWAFAAILPLNLPILSRQGDVFVEIAISRVSGRVGFAITGEDMASVLAQSELTGGAEEQRFVFRIPARRHCTLVVRQWETAQPGGLCISNLSIYQDISAPAVVPDRFLLKSPGTKA